MRETCARMARWAAHCPANFLHLNLLMQAELARLAGRIEPALRLYDQAMDAARRSEFRRDEAMANELAARHLLAADRRKAAEGYFRAARNLYERWGARRKVAHLEEEFPQILGASTPAHVSAGAAGGEMRSAVAATIDSAALDMASVMKASQAISSEIVLEQLWTITMRIMLENAGGQRGCFVVRKDGQLVIEGLSEVGGDTASAARSIPFAGAEGALALPISIVYQVLHTNSPVVLHDAAQGRGFRQGRLSAGAQAAVGALHSAGAPRQIRRRHLHGEQPRGGVFTEDRIEVIKLLAAQVSISVENAKLYEEPVASDRGAAPFRARASSWKVWPTTTSRALALASTSTRR